MIPIKTPASATLRKYGMDIEDWNYMVEEQDGKCAVCLKQPNTGRLCIDHKHVTGWKKMPPDRRRYFVRGLLCWFCNRYYVCKGITAEKAERVRDYLARHDAGLARLEEAVNAYKCGLQSQAP